MQKGSKAKMRISIAHKSTQSIIFKAQFLFESALNEYKINNKQNRKTHSRFLIGCFVLYRHFILELKKRNLKYAKISTYVLFKFELVNYDQSEKRK
jgi:hypothetical protein